MDNMTENTRNELTALAELSLRQLQSKCKLSGNWHTRSIGTISNVQGEHRGTASVSFFDKHHSPYGCPATSVEVRILIVVNRFGVVRTVVNTKTAYRDEQKVIVEGKDACKVAKAVRDARASYEWAA